MREADDQPVQVRPLGELVIGPIDPQYLSRIRWYLERVLSCRMVILPAQRGYVIQLPAGTVEEVYAGQSTPRTFRTTVRFANGVTLTKYVTSPLNATLRGQAMLAFPNELLEGPEPPE
jgi:hypothetical protein